MNFGQIDNTMDEILNSAFSAADRTRMSDGPALFNRDDVRKSRNDLDLMMRYMFDSMHISKSYLNDKCVDYYQTILKHSRDKAKSDTQNLIRTLEKGDITNNRFEEALTCLGFEILDRSITVKDDIGEIHTFSTSAAHKACHEDEDDT